MEHGDGARLAPTLGVAGVVFLTFSALSPAVSVYIFGSGVFHLGGTGAVTALLVGGAAVAIVGLLYGELASAFPDAGGVFPAFAKILGMPVAFPYIAMMLFLAPAQLAFVMLGVAENAVALWPALPLIPTAFAGLVAAAAIAVLNVRTGALITGLFLAIELVALLVITGVAALHPARALVPTMLHPITLAGGALVPLPLPLLGLAVATGVYTCGGANWATYFAQEMVGAETRIGRLIAWISPLAALSIAGPLVLALLSAPDLRALLASGASIATFLDQTTSPAVATFINCSVLLALFNALVANLMGLSRFLYATGRDGILPGGVGRFIAQLHPRLRSPLNATLVLAAAGAALIALGERVLLVVISTELILEFLLMGFAVLIGRRRTLTGRHYRTPLHPLVPLLAIAVAGALIAANWFDADVGRPSLFVLAGLIAASIGYERLVLNRAAAPSATAK